VANPDPIQDPTCIFCRIIAGQSPAEILYQDEEFTAFRDARPAAPVHVLVAPNRHIASLNELPAEEYDLVGRLAAVARKMAAQEGIDRRGFRLVINTGGEGGQTVFHLHLHVLGGKQMRALG
jgi:histidine triad (HIT) family protein